jgi:hypothetical protein
MPQQETLRIALRALDISELLNSLDPSPFAERDLDEAVARFIIDSASGRADHRPVAIAIALADTQANRARQSELKAAIERYFAAEERGSARALSELFAVGRQYLAVGVAILAVCVGASQWVRGWTGASVLKDVLAEGVLILGWVANWKPIETFFYDWRPIRRRMTLYRRLAGARVDFEYYPQPL